jgi:hypothetical protein
VGSWPTTSTSQLIREDLNNTEMIGPSLIVSNLTGAQMATGIDQPVRSSILRCSTQAHELVHKT